MESESDVTDKCVTFFSISEFLHLATKHCAISEINFPKKMADQVLEEAGEIRLKEKVVLISIIGEEIKAAREKAMLLHKKGLNQTEANFKLLLDKKVEKFKGEKQKLVKKVEKYESENRRLKEALGAARVRLLGLAEREDDVVALEKKLEAAENRIQLLQEKEKSEEDSLSRSSLPVETSELIGRQTKVITGEGTKSCLDRSIASRTRGSKRKGAAGKKEKEAKERRKSWSKGEEDLTDVDTLERRPTTEVKLMSTNTSISKTMSREVQKMPRSQGYMDQTVSNILETYQHVLTKTSI